MAGLRGICGHDPAPGLNSIRGRPIPRVHPPGREEGSALTRGSSPSDHHPTASPLRTDSFRSPRGPGEDGTLWLHVRPAEGAVPVKGMERMLELQQVDLAIDRLRSRQDAVEAGQEVGEARARAEEAEQALGELRLQLSAIDRDVQRLENDADMLGQKADAEEKRLYDGSVANPKELEAIQHEVASVRERRRRVDDQLLDRMVEREDLETRMAEAEAELQRLRRALDELRGEAGVELDQIAVSLRERETEREALLPLFDEELLGLYEDLRRSKRGVAAAALVDGVCQGCHTKLSSAEIARLKTVDLKRCEYCDRILVPAST